MAESFSAMEEEEEAVGLGCALSSFSDLQEIILLIENLKSSYEQETIVEALVDKFKFIIDKYQEQPHLIDPHLENILSRLVTIIRDPSTNSVLVNNCFKYLYLIIKVRGFKIVIRYLPHEVSDVEPILDLIQQQEKSDSTSWETRYVLLLWLSIIIIIPFDLSRLDSNSSQKSVSERIITLSKEYLGVSDKSQDATAYLLAKFLTRPDVVEKHLTEFLNWSMQILTSEDSNSSMATIFLHTGILEAMALIFKHGKRSDLLPFVKGVLVKILTINYRTCGQTLFRKLMMKLIQRLGLTFLKPRLAHWRYQRGSRSLTVNLSKQSLPSTIDNEEVILENDDEDFDIPEEIEDIIEHLLIGLQDKDTVVRWSSAKGLGRITGRLPQTLGDDVVRSILDLFSFRETDSAWHGGCLALAELGRRGLLLPDRLEDVIPVILKALVFDEQKGNFSVGSHIRDAACYVCWAFARAYEPNILEPYVMQIAGSLLITTVFDREVNCRRAASAAFQEHVGRQGTFPHGIDILTKADYFAVGSRNNTYLDLSYYIGQFEEYTVPLITHLTERKINHWDPTIRALAAQALNRLTSCAAEHMETVVLPHLFCQSTNIDLNARHGAILALADVIHALSEIHQKEDTKYKKSGKEILQKIREIICFLHDKKMFRGIGGELTKQAVNVLIEKSSLSKLPYDNETLDMWQQFINENLHYEGASVQVTAVKAFSALCSECYNPKYNNIEEKKKEQIVSDFVIQLQAANQTSRIGYSQALGTLPAFMLEGSLPKILEGLKACSEVRNKEEQNWAEARKTAVSALVSVCETVGFSPDGDENKTINNETLKLIFECLLKALEDYTMDSRGDIGSKLREASICGIQAISKMVVEVDPQSIEQEMCSKLMSSLVQQALEKIDRTRGLAARIFYEMLYNSPEIPHIPDVEEVKGIFSESKCDNLNWGSSAQTFPLFTQLLRFPSYHSKALLGLTVSVGGITESLVKHSSAAFFSFLKLVSSDEDYMHSFLNTLIQIFSDNLQITRISLPMLSMLDQLMSTGTVTKWLTDADCPFAISTFDLVKKEIVNCGDPFKLMAAVSVLCGLLQSHKEVRQKALFQIAIFLCHKYPRIRKDAANKFYEAIITYDTVVEENVEPVIQILTDTNWDKPLATVRPIRNELCLLLNIPQPKLITKTAKS